MKMHSVGEVARLLGLSRDQIQTARRNGIPKQLTMSGGRYQYTQAGIYELFRHFRDKKYLVREPGFTVEAEQ